MNKIIIIIISIIILILILGIYWYLNKPKTDLFEPVVKETRNCRELTSAERDSCYQNKALSELDASYCDKIQTDSFFVSKDTCYNLIASKTKDEALCDKIQKQELKENCLEITQ